MRCHFPLKSQIEGRNHFLHLLRGFMGKFQSEMTDAGSAPLVEVRTGFLRLGAKNGVAASHVGNHRVRAARGILQLDTMLLTRAPAIPIAGSCR